MSAKDIADLFNAAIGKVEFYWNFLAVTVVAIIGWILAAKKPFAPIVRKFLATFYVAFAVTNYYGLWISYRFTETLRADLVQLKPKDIPSTVVALGEISYKDDVYWAAFIHLVVGVLMLYMILKYSPKPDRCEA